MSFITDGKTLCRDMWPANSGHMSGDADKTERVASWRLLPSTYERLCERVFLEGMSSVRPRVVTLDTDTNTRTELCVRLVGIVGKASLSIRGDWKGDESEAMKAMQTLSLVNFGCRSAFAHQRNAMANLEELILAMLNQQGGGNVIEKGAIVLKRRAFTKAGEGVKSIKILDSDESAEEIRDMDKSWVVDHRITTAVVEKGGVIARVSPYAIRRGDLVDVAATFELVNVRGRRGRKTEVMLSPRQVVRLKTAMEIKRIVGQAKGATATPTGRDDVVMGTEDVVPAGVVFDPTSQNGDTEDGAE